MDLSGIKKLELNVELLARQSSDPKPFAAIVRVNRPDYVPDCIRLRMKISSTIFTADISPDNLNKLEEDELVVSISAGKRLRVGG